MLVLASSSPYRAALLERLRLPFTTADPAVDETPLAGETPADLAHRLAAAKASAVARAYGTAPVYVIGSDQVAERDGVALGKPGSVEAAARQLGSLSGRALLMHTGLSVIDCARGRQRTLVEPFSVRFRPLTEAAIAAYLRAEQPVDAAGSFYAEGFGIVLFERFEGRDPNALVGLPLMALVDLLGEFGVDVVTAAR